jgi:mannose-1-phosphate guanylyltransferase
MLNGATEPRDNSPHDASFWTVIPAGGSGTRLWPLSRAARPKFLLPQIKQEV